MTIKSLATTAMVTAELSVVAVPSVTLPDLTTVNRLKLDELTAAGMLGAVKVTGFSAIAVTDGMATLGVVIERSDNLGESVEWRLVSTNEAVVPAPGERGFFIVAPPVISK